MSELNKKLETSLIPLLDATKKALIPLRKSLTEKDFGPFIPYVFEEYESERIKIMFVGQQTNGGTKVQDFIEGNYHYIDFVGAWMEFCHDDVSSISHYQSPFWNFIHSACKQVSVHKLGFVWSNIVKFESNNAFPKNDLYEIERKFFNSTPTEIGIFKPDVVIFLTGPNYDFALKSAFPGVSFIPIHKFPIRQFCEVRNFPAKKCFRLHHPRYLRTYTENLIGLISEINKIRGFT